MFVVITHYKWVDNTRNLLLFPFWIDMAVPLFMVGSGYVNSLSYIRNSISSIEEVYTVKFLTPKVMRLLLPFMIACFVEFLGELLVKGKIGLGFFVDIFRGGIGPGSYYFPIMIQFLLIFPILYFIVKRYEFKGVSIALCINALYEFFQRIYFVNAELYRLLLFRYTSLIGVGIYLALYPNKPIKTVVRLVLFFIGLVFIIATSYVGYSPKVIIYWTGTCFIATFLIWDFCFRYFKMKNPICFRPLEIVGKASYHIFLVQMVFYVYGVGLVYSVVPSPITQLLVNMFICVLVGLVFYWVEDGLRKRILSLINLQGK